MRATMMEVGGESHRLQPVGREHEQPEGDGQQADGATERQLHAPAVPHVRDDAEQILWRSGASEVVEH